MAERRDVKVTLDIGLGPQGERALKDVQRSLDDTTKAQERWAKATTAPAAQGQVIGGTTGSNVLTAGSPAGGKSGANPMMAAMGRYFAAVVAIDTAARAAENLALAYHDPYMTNAQIGRKFFRDVVPGGERMQRIVDAFSGRAAGMQQAEIFGQRRTLELAAQTQMSQFNIGYQPQQVGREAFAAQMRGASPILLGGVDRTTAVGERTFREESRLLPLRRELAMLERTANASTKERLAAEGELYKINVRGNELENRRAQLARRIAADNSSGVDRQRMLKELTATENALQDVAKTRQQAAESVSGAKMKEAQSRSAVANQQAQIAEARAANLEERAATAAGSARRLGAMTPIDRALALQSVQMVQQFGPDAIPPEMLQQAMSIAPETVGKIVEMRGAQTREFAQFREVAPADFAGDPERLRQEAQSARDLAEETRVKATQDLSRASAEAGRDLGSVVAQQIMIVKESAIREIETQIRIRNNSQ